MHYKDGLVNRLLIPHSFQLHPPLVTTSHHLGCPELVSSTLSTVSHQQNQLPAHHCLLAEGRALKVI